MQTDYFRSESQELVRVNDFIRSVYGWMAGGLAVTAVIAYVFSQSIRLSPGIFFILMLAELGLVFFLSAKIQAIQASTATALFMVYSALNGVTLSSILVFYTGQSIASTFFVCAATFLGCSVYGMATKKDLTSVGSFMFMGLIGIIIASLVNIFVRSSAMEMIISYIGVFVFVGLTAYDTQKLKMMAITQPMDIGHDVVRKGAIIGALTLYLDFINLFLMLLRIMGVAGDRD
ncbi:MAG: Bax inhibitor-1/YccA family protein [Desulfobacterales bacterium]|nr:Bax inhibitor-1/YccA family protein [Desulfobacterales bacterium]